MKDTKLYVNLTVKQQTALDHLDMAFGACMDAGVKHADVKDTVEVWLTRIQSVEVIKADHDVDAVLSRLSPQDLRGDK